MCLLFLSEVRPFSCYSNNRILLFTTIYALKSVLNEEISTYNFTFHYNSDFRLEGAALSYLCNYVKPRRRNQELPEVKGHHFKSWIPVEWIKVIDLTFRQLTFWYVFLTFVAYKHTYTIPYCFRANFNLPDHEFYPVREENLASLLNIISLA